MKNLLTIYLLLFTWIAFGQGIDKVKKDTINLKHKGDTIILKPNNVGIDSVGTESSQKLIIINENKSEDKFKYILPIFTLLLGIAINKVLDYWSDRKKTKKAGKRWLAEIRCLESPIKMQIEVLEKFLKSHEKETFETPNLATYSILNCEIFKSLDKGELLKYIQSQRKADFKDIVKASNTVHGYIAILTYLYETLKSDFEKYQTESTVWVNSLNTNLQSLLRESADYGILIENQTGKDPISDPQYKLITDLITKYIMPKSQTGDYDVFLLEKEFFIPLLTILGNLRLDFRTKNLSNYTSYCLNDIKAIRLEKQYFKENLTMIISNYKQQLVEFETITKTIENKN